jgi:flagellar biosynthesis/type III secretory pathway M-ring protein FliF/YscJ
MLRSFPPGLAVVACICALVGTARAQDDNAIKVTSVLHADGTRTVRQVNPEARTSETATYDAANKLLQRTLVKLNDDNQPVEGAVYGPKGNVLMTATYKVDVSGRVTEETNYSPNGAFLRRLVYQYDTSGRITKVDAFDASGNPIAQSPTGGGASRKSRSRK